MEDLCSRNINTALCAALSFLSTRHSPELPSPADCLKRASVAVIIGFKNAEMDVSPGEEAVSVDVPSESFLEVKSPYSLPQLQYNSISQLEDLPDHLEAHCLFIRRSSREGDRWSSHIALPGGKREPSESDRDAAIRETMEEVGLDISPDRALFVGSLGQRLVTTSFGTRNLLTLCPYVFVLKSVGLPTLTLQESEVASAHWVSFRSLLDASARAKESVDLGSRFASKRSSTRTAVLRALCGQMYFSAIRLRPTRSIFSHQTQPDKGHMADISKNDGLELLLWGLTLGVMTDLLDLVHIPGIPRARDLWHFPSFSAIDMNFVLWLLNTPSRMALPRIPRLTLDGTHQEVQSEAEFSTDKAMDFTGNASKVFLQRIRPAIAITIIFRVSTIVAAVLWYRKYITRIKQ